MTLLTRSAACEVTADADRKPQGEAPERWWRPILAGFSWALLAAVVAIAAAVIVVPTLFGAKTFAVLTGSMEPTYPPGTLVVVQPTAIDELQLGDVITFQLRSGEPQVATHRIVGVGSDETGARLFVTRGDANNVDDEMPVRPVQVVGKLWYSVPYIGWINNVFTGVTRAWVLPAVAAGLLGYGVVTIVRGLREREDRRVASTGSGSAHL